MNNEHSNSGAVMRKLMERIEALETEKSALQQDIKGIRIEARSMGFDMKTFNEMLRLRKMDADKRREQEELRDMYINALDLI